MERTPTMLALVLLSSLAVSQGGEIADAPSPTSHDLQPRLLDKYNYPTPPPIPTPDISELDNKQDDAFNELEAMSKDNGGNQIHGAFMRGLNFYKKTYDRLKTEMDKIKILKAQADKQIAAVKSDIQAITEAREKAIEDKKAKDLADEQAAKKRLAEEQAATVAKLKAALGEDFKFKQMSLAEKQKMLKEKLGRELSKAELDALAKDKMLQDQKAILAEAQAQAEAAEAKVAGDDAEIGALGTQKRKDSKIMKDSAAISKKNKLKNSLKNLRKMMGAMGGGSAASISAIADGTTGEAKNDKDEHGCYQGAGEVWCGPKEMCIQPTQQSCPGMPGSGKPAAVDPDKISEQMNGLASLIFGDDPEALAEAKEKNNAQKKLAESVAMLEDNIREKRRALTIVMTDNHKVRNLALPTIVSDYGGDN